MQMRVLIAGGCGFVGGRLATHLTEGGCLVRLGSRQLVMPPSWLPEAEITKLDWDDASALENSCADADVVIQASGMNAQDCAADPLAALSFNAIATARLASAALRAGVKRFLYLSTVHVYSSSLEGVITEDTCPKNTDSYAASHLAGEYAILDLNKKGHFKTTVLRLSNAFGAPVHKDVNCWMLLVNDLCRQAHQIGKIVLHGNGQQRRDFIALKDVCNVIEELIINKSHTDIPEVINVVSGNSLSVIAMAEVVQKRCAEILGYSPEIEISNVKKDKDQPPLLFKTERLENLGFTRLGEIDHSEIDQLINFVRNNYPSKMETS